MNLQKVPQQKETLGKKQFFIGVLRYIAKIAGSGSISQRHGSADPDPYQNVTDPQHYFREPKSYKNKLLMLEGFTLACHLRRACYWR
jgi:hypothetical protein